MLPQVRARLGRAIEYHADVARSLGGDDHLERYNAKRAAMQETSSEEAEAPSEEDAGRESVEQQPEGDQARERPRRGRRRSDAEAPARKEEQQDPAEYWADCHADAARQLGELLAADAPEPAIHATRRDRAATGLLNRLGLRR